MKLNHEGEIDECFMLGFFIGGIHLIGIYLICFILFPLCVMVQAKKITRTSVMLEKQDTEVIKGIATCFVILAHLIQPLKTISGYSKFLNLYSIAVGGVGVLLFFFVSGYGLFKSYRDKEFDTLFLKKRFLNVYFPCVFIQMIFCLVNSYMQQSFNIVEMILDILFGAWFIDVIMIQYFIFFISWKFAKGRHDIWITLSFLGSMIVALVFIHSGFNARWYNGLMLFPFGMLIAYKEEKLISLILKKWNVSLLLSAIMFTLSGVFFSYFKGNSAVINIVKTFSGMCLSMMVCVMFLRIKFCSKLMLYIGKRSLYFYLVHVNLLSILLTIEGIREVPIFYMVLILTFFIVEVFYRLRIDEKRLV